MKVIKLAGYFYSFIGETLYIGTWIENIPDIELKWLKYFS